MARSATVGRQARSQEHGARVLGSIPYKWTRVVVIALGAIYALSTLIPGERPKGLDTWFYAGVLIVTSLFALARPLLVSHNRIAWLCVALGVTSWSIGDIYLTFAFMDSPDSPPVPSFADPFYEGLYPLAYIGLVLLARAAVNRLPASVWLDGVITSFAAAAVFSALTLSKILASRAGGSNTKLAETLTNLSYPIGDLILVVVVVAALAMVRWRADPVWWLLGLGAAVFAVADTAYLFKTANETYEDGRWVDGGWMLGLTLMAVAGSLLLKKPAEDVQGLAALLVPVLFSLAALTVLIIGTFVHLHPVTIVLAGGALVAAGVRTALTFEQTKALARSQLEAKTDELSGLGNRRLLDDALPAMLPGGDAAGAITAGPGDPRQLGLTIIAVDHLGEINGTLGYPVGDAILNEIGTRLRDELPEGTVIARLGGAEMAVLRPVRTDFAAIHRDTRALLASLATPVLVNGVAVHIELSSGVALSPLHAAAGPDLIRFANDALRRAKTTRSEVEIYDPEQDLGRQFGPGLFADLVRAFSDNQFAAYFQPKISLSTGRPVDLEAMLRWHHPVHGVIGPEVLLPLADRAGMTRQLTEVLVESALRRCSSWRRQGIEFGVTMDLTAADVLNSRLPYDLAKMINAFELPPAAVTLEIAEEVLLVDPRRTSYALGQFRIFGVRLALDHFGRSAPSITRLRALPVDELKLDASFIAPVLHSPQDSAIVRAIVELARSLDIRTVADGVDSRELLHAVAALGFAGAQGAAAGEAMDSATLARWLERADPNANRARGAFAPPPPAVPTTGGSAFGAFGPPATGTPGTGAPATTYTSNRGY